MRVLFCVRHNFHTSPGGAQVQILKTVAELKKLGCECDLTTDPSGCDLRQYDLVNLTDLTWIYDLLKYIELFKPLKIPMVLTTIYWPLDDYSRNAAPFFQRMIFRLLGINGVERAKAIYKLLRQRNGIYWQGIFHSYIGSQRKIVTSVDWMLPNSHLEQQAMNERLHTDLTNYSVVNNALDLTAFNRVRNSVTVKRDDNLLLCVGRIDPRKNQLGLLRAVYDLPYRVCFIGQAGPNSAYYYRRLRKLGARRGNTEFVSQIPQEKVFEYMLAAKAHALPSWVETPGLVSLEAYYAGCNIAVAEKGSVKEYFHDSAFYCDPADIDSIRTAVQKAMTEPYSDRLRQVIEEKYSWEYAAKQTFAAYKKVLARCGKEEA